MNVVDGLVRAFDSATSKQCTLSLVIDGAQSEGCNQQLDRWKIFYLSLFDGTPEESLIEIAPLLVPTSGMGTSDRLRLFSWAQDLAYRFPMVSWVESTLSAEQLADHLRSFHVVGLSEGQSMLLRWYDTRILPIWLACLTGAQSQAFAAGSLQWDYVDRSGNVSTLLQTAAAQPLPAAPAFGEPLIVLTDAQYGMLVDVADLDVMLARLRRVIPDEIKQVPKSTLTRFVARYQQDAVKAGLNDIDRQAQYVLLALYTSGKGLEQAEFKAFMKSPPASFDDFSNGIQALPEKVWNAGPPLWDALPQSSVDVRPMPGRANA